MKSWRWLLASMACLVLLTGCGGHDDIDMPTRLGLAAMRSDVLGVMAHADDSLVDGWGVAFNPMRFVWVADNGAGKSTPYDGKGVPPSLVVAIVPRAAGDARPTGIVFSGTTDFVVSAAGCSGPGQQDADGDEEERAGPGVVDVFGSAAVLMRHLVAVGPLDASWGLVPGAGGLRHFQQRAAVGQLR